MQSSQFAGAPERGHACLPPLACNTCCGVAEVYFVCAAAVCLLCLFGYVAILPRLTPGLARKRQAALDRARRTSTEIHVPMAQPIAGYHAANEQGEASPRRLSDSCPILWLQMPDRKCCLCCRCWLPCCVHKACYPR